MPLPAPLNPRRSAHATIRGYLYQTCLGVLRWLDLQPNEILLCEGDEDLDRFLLGGESISEQVKAYTGSLSLSDRAVLESLGNFLRSYVTLRQRGETRKFVFTTTAAEKRPGGKGLDFDLLEAWRSGKRTKKILNGARSLLKPKKKDKHEQETTDAIAWLDAQPDGWKDFLDAVGWSFDAPDLDAIRGKIKNRIALLESTQSLPAETLTERLISHVFHTSIQSEHENRTLTQKSLSDLLDTARTDLGNWAKTRAAERLRTVFDELRQIQRLLHDNTSKLPKNAAPGKLLTAAYEVIPFDQQGRREELDFLTSWCDGDDQKSVLLLTGEGGSGKTRLMIEWCRHLRHQGWHAGFLGRDRKAEELDPLLEGLAPRMIVVDYAETRLEVVEPLLLKMGLSKEAGPKLRLVLLARRKADWWGNLLQKGREVEDLILGSPKPKAMTPLVPRNVQERKQAFQEAVAGFSLQIDRKPPQDLFVPDLTREHFDRVLYLHMAALAALQGERIESAESALRETLKHERLFWDQQVSDLGLDGTWEPLVRQALEILVAAVTLVGGAKDTQHARSILDRTIRNSPLQGQHADALLRLLRHLYASPDEGGRFCDPLQPDLLGEELVAENLDSEFFRQILGESTSEEGYSVLTVLTRLAQRRPVLSKWLGLALNSKLETLAEVALDVAVDTGDPVGSQLAVELENSGSTEVLLQIQRLCDKDKYRDSVPLREVAHVATEKGLGLLRARRAYLSEEEQSEYAGLANNLGNRLSDLGRREDALNATDEAVQIYRLLAKQRPYAFNPHLAMSLNNLGNCLSDLGRREDALDATDEAVQIRRLLAKQRPDAFTPHLASSLNNLGIRLSDLGRREDALNATNEAVQIYRLLAKQRPDDFNPVLAMSLDNLGNVLSDLRRREDALNATNEAVQIYQFLAKQRPDSFNPDLATSLHNLGNILSELGRREDALNATDEAVQIRRLLAKQRPDAFNPVLATSLSNLGDTLSELGRADEAFKASEEAVSTLSPFFLRLPQAFDPWMTTMVRNYLEYAEAAGREPDEELLAPILQIFEALSGPQDQEVTE